jgi:hypothetical protein
MLPTALVRVVGFKMVERVLVSLYLGNVAFNPISALTQAIIFAVMPVMDKTHFPGLYRWYKCGYCAVLFFNAMFNGIDSG